MSVGMSHHSSKRTPAGDASIISALRRIYRHLPRLLGWRLMILLALMLMGALAELMTIGAVLPFLTFLANGEGAGGFAGLRRVFAGLGFESWREQVLAATLLFAGTAVGASTPAERPTPSARTWSTSKSIPKPARWTSSAIRPSKTPARRFTPAT